MAVGLGLHFLIRLISNPACHHFADGLNTLSAICVGMQQCISPCLKEVIFCCLTVHHLVEVVTSAVPTFQPIAMHLLLPHPLSLVHLPHWAQRVSLPLAPHLSVQILQHQADSI